MVKIMGALLVGALCVAPLSAKTKDDVFAPERVSDPDDKIICKRYTETGSLVRVRKVCGTKADWEKKREDLHNLSVVNSCRLASEGGC